MSGFVLQGSQAEERSGASVSNLGDFNGDGLDDLLIGASSVDYYNKPEAAYLIFGTNEFSERQDIDLAHLSAEQGIRIAGIDGGDSFPFDTIQVSSAGDLNGDGLDDFLIGSPSGNPANAFTGATYVIFGQAQQASFPSNLATLSSAAGVVISGEQRFDRIGRRISAAGDFNGDGFGDILIGAEGATQGSNTRTGKAYLLYGDEALNELSSLSLKDIDGQNGVAFYGAEYSEVGSHISKLGDINGDGLDDIAIGSVRDQLIYIVYGSNDPIEVAATDLNTLNGSNGLILDVGNLSVLNFLAYGRSMDPLGDVNGDGFDDFIISSNDQDSSDVAYLIFGHAFRSQPNPVQLADLLLTNGLTINSSSGTYDDVVSKAGDVNGDGFDDILISGFQSRLIFGSPDLTTIKTLDIANPVDEISIEFSPNLGSTINGGGDINGDGFDDLVVGNSVADPNFRFNSGLTTVVFGSDSIADSDSIDISTFQEDVCEHANQADYARVSTVIGDINGDGFNEVVIATDDPASTRTLYLPTRHLQVNDCVLIENYSEASVTIDWSEELTNDYNYSKLTIQSVGDINGDGFDEIGITTSYYRGRFDNREQFYVIFGQENAAGQTFDVSSLSEDQGFQAESTQAQYSSFDYGGSADIDGDGFDDLLLGRPYTGAYYAGSLKILFGDSEGIDFDTSVIFNDYDDDAYRFIGNYFGASIQEIGDLNQDGRADFEASNVLFLGGPRSRFNTSIPDLIRQGVAGFSGENELDNLMVGSPEADRRKGREGNDNIWGLAGDDTLIGNQGNDRLKGDRGSDHLQGRSGNDVLVGGAGHDVLVGGAGRDRLIGGPGVDSLHGGTGIDSFVFQTIQQNPDRIVDFKPREDLILLKKAGLGLDLSLGELLNGRFTLGGAAQDASDRLIYNTNTGHLLFDADGSRAGKAQTIAILSSIPALTASDIRIF